MANEATEIRKQLTVYADGITAFATAQLVGYVFLMAHGDCFTKNVLGGVWYAVFIGGFVNVAYLSLVALCHYGMDKISVHSVGVLSAMPNVWILRYLIIVVDLAATVSLPLAISHAAHRGHFFIDCHGI